ncbi:hypothetical protein C8J56DRAFT_1053559 [Mycena floridula]|nr:hypothetical protein C8J56DRAFT_1053559 [Mycena floridula]
MDWMTVCQTTLSLCDECHHCIVLPERTRMLSTSPLSHALYSPDENEQQQALKSIWEADQDIGQLEEAMGRVSRILESLTRCRDERARDRSTFRALLSPLRRIPNEIWIKVFPWTVQGTAADLTLLQVCRHWRDFLLSSPQIFDRVQLDLSDVNVDARLPNQFMFHYGNRLHGKMPARIDIRLPEPLQYCVLEKGSAESKQFLNSLGRHVENLVSQSWWATTTHLRFLNYSPNEWEPALHKIFFCGPVLEQLTICSAKLVNCESFGGLSWSSILKCFKHCSNLRHFVLPDGDLYNGGLAESIELTASTPNNGMHVIDCHAKSLISFSMCCGEGKTFIYYEWQERSALPKLTHLAIQSPHSIDQMLAALYCPALTSLYLSGELSWDSLSHFIVRSRCAIDTLSIGASSISPKNLEMEFVDLLRTIPTVRHFIYFEPSREISSSSRHIWPVHPVSMSDIVLQALSLPCPYPLLPVLKNFSVWCLPTQLDTLLLMAESRLELSERESNESGTAVLRTLVVDLLESETVNAGRAMLAVDSNSMIIEEDFDRRVEKLRRRGLTVYRLSS